MEILIQLLLFVVPLVVFGLIIGRTVEKRHLRTLDQYEAENRDFLVTNSKTFPMAVPGGSAPSIVMSEVVIGSDYLKNFLSGWRSIFGGEMKSLQTLQIRAKREVIARLIEQAKSQGHNAICNLRIDGLTIVGATKAKSKMLMASVMGTATAYTVPRANSGPGADAGPGGNV